MTTWPTLTLASGPVEVHERTLRDQARPVLYHYDPAFIELFDRTATLLQQVYRTKYDVVIMQGEALLGLEAAAASLISPGDKVLNLVSGVFGKGFEFFIEKYGGVTVELAVPYNEAVDPEAVRRALSDRDIKLLAVVHSETPSATLNPVKDIGGIARERGVRTIVDTVSGLGGELLSPEEWGMDVAVAGPQKCLGGPPGLSLMTVSPAAWDAMERRRPAPLRGSYLSILDWKDTWLERKVLPYTPSVSLVYALESVLTQVLEEGVERYAERHQRIARACRAGVKAMGLKLWAAREAIAAPCVTGVTSLDGLPDKILRAHMRERYGVMISGGYGDMAGRAFRLGHMGKAAHPAYLAAQLAVLERSLRDLGHGVALGSGVGAAMEALDW